MNASTATFVVIFVRPPLIVSRSPYVHFYYSFFFFNRLKF